MSHGAKAAGGVGMMGLAGAAFDGVTTYAAERMENPESSKGVALAKAGATAAAWMFAEPLMWGITLGQGAVGLGKMAYAEGERNRKQENDINMHVRKDRTGKMGGTLGGNFQDSQNAYTMRQRQMDLLRSHKMATESILGSEARQLHR
jgi:hypothetical protein